VHYYSPDFFFIMKGKTILLGVTGSIAAYKAADLLRELQARGADVHVLMTDSAQRFITALTFNTLSRNPVASSLWEEESGWCPGHIELADKADLFLVAPATANVLAQFAQGLASNLLTSVYLATRAPVLIAPAMNGKMWDHPATQQNRAILEERGHVFIEPSEGELACGYSGNGKLAGIAEIVVAAEALLPG
jgi:phosphopantothenoylcysteine decarboxylase